MREQCGSAYQTPSAMCVLLRTPSWSAWWHDRCTPAHLPGARCGWSASAECRTNRSRWCGRWRVRLAGSAGWKHLGSKNFAFRRSATPVLGGGGERTIGDELDALVKCSCFFACLWLSSRKATRSWCRRCPRVIRTGSWSGRCHPGTPPLGPPSPPSHWPMLEDTKTVAAWNVSSLKETELRNICILLFISFIYVSAKVYNSTDNCVKNC